ncbi:hypothetical protein HQ587_00770 [bacterium]|nr:hypothetical protein [bacterium]
MQLSFYKYRGARAIILLHEMEMWRFLTVWHEAQEAGIALPATDDADYASWGALLRHVMRASRGYMTWICKVLELPDPKIRPTPEADVIEAEADEYLKHLIDRWRRPLADVPEERFYEPAYKSHWGSDYCIDSMLEHAVMHPIRHSFQLEELMMGKSK